MSNLPKENITNQNIFKEVQAGGDIKVGNINQYFGSDNPELSQKLESLASRIQSLESLAGLADSQPIPLTIKQSSPQNSLLLFDLLLQIDFKKQFRLVKIAIAKHQIIHDLAKFSN